MNIPVQVIGPAYALIVITCIAILLVKNKMSERIGIPFLILSIAIPGLLLGGMPNPIAPIQQLVYNITHSLPVPVFVIGLILVLITVFIAGRIFCGYVCPLGALQELISMIVKKQYMVDPKISGLIRAAVFVVFILSGLIVPWYMKLDPFAVFTLKPNIFQAILFTLVLAASIFIYRPWCTLICPFGALSSLITRFSLFKICIDEKCNDCGLCRKKCPTCQPGKDSPMGECYFCARCIGVCKKGSLKSKLRV